MTPVNNEARQGCAYVCIALALILLACCAGLAIGRVTA